MNGIAHKFGSNVNTDEIIPARYMNTADPAELAKHCMEDIDSEFMKRIKKGDIIVGEENFGCGSSREHAPIAIKHAGISCVIAKTFARIFFRNSINMGLPILESPSAVDGIKSGDEIEVELLAGVIRNVSTGKVFKSHPFPEFMQKIIDSGGLMKYIKKNKISCGRKDA